jgi:hypothetical protein
MDRSVELHQLFARRICLSDLFRDAQRALAISVLRGLYSATDTYISR